MMIVAIHEPGYDINRKNSDLSEDLNHGFKLYVGIKKEFLTKTENLKNEGSGRWGAIRPVDECPAPTVAERRPEPWVQVTLRYYKKNL